MSKKSRRREAVESAWHICFALLALAGAVYHEVARRGRRRGERDSYIP